MVHHIPHVAAIARDKRERISEYLAQRGGMNSLSLSRAKDVTQRGDGERQNEIQCETELIDCKSLPSEKSLFVDYDLLWSRFNGVGFRVFHLIPCLSFRAGIDMTVHYPMCFLPCDNCGLGFDYYQTKPA